MVLTEMALFADPHSRELTNSVDEIAQAFKAMTPQLRSTVSIRDSYVNLVDFRVILVSEGDPPVLIESPTTNAFWR